jgi:hypothetical protein
VILSSIIDVVCSDEYLDFEKPAVDLPLVLPDLAGIYIGHANKLIDAGIAVRAPCNNTVSWVRQTFRPDGTPAHALGGWEPTTRSLCIRQDLGWAPLLVSDVVAHEIVHQLITDNPIISEEEDSQSHGSWFQHVARVVGPILGLPAPCADTIAVWPQFERPNGFYGPNVTMRKEKQHA